ncbi:MAG: LPS export ABC transporter ATP-binding protein [Kiritimatiellia bacterium]|nr:LPS export ABC transporter ATP-binding protein [Kiritimatiellia bacterium]MDP6630713.1 LPS export ABC transporter ATP-binding protein [Kiritimatiellia bacterium]MDP6809424.1 LPS export ABC transporter ATP-binding protein [Kiritimatiellia bacterium]MDP7023899.1 LPS export ABC transporter ATP-binding protein [Kiritimatiellia bacterium]
MLLKASGIEKSYRGRPVVKGVDLEVRRGEIVGLLGPNGAGKTTTFYTVVGLVRADGGSIVFDGHDVTQAPVYQRARLGVGYLAQEPSVFRKLTVEQNVGAILETLDMDADAREERAAELLADLGLTKVAKQRAYTLSGGERRKLEIARSLVRDPKMLMLDEPFSGVDPLAVSDIQEIVRGLRDRGLGLLITDHNVRETLAVVDRAYLLYDGKVLRDGASDFLINDEMSRKLYLGDKFKM